MSWAWPRLIAPLFNKFHELPDGDLRAGVIGLARRCGFEPSGVFVMDGSRRSAHGNAYFTGLGRAKRIVFFDTLLEALAAGEVEADARARTRALPVAACRVANRLVACGLIRRVCVACLARWRAMVPARPRRGRRRRAYAVPAVRARRPVFLLPAGPLAAWLSRRHEYAADAFAARHADAEALSSALVKLYRDNATTLTPDPLYTAFHASHPPAIDRIGRLAARTSG